MALGAGLGIAALGVVGLLLSRRLAAAYFRAWGRRAEQLRPVERGVVLSCLVGASLAITAIGLYLAVAVG